MTWQWWALAGLALATLALTLALVRLRARTAHDLTTSRAEAEALRERLDRLEREHARPATAPVQDEGTHTITRVGGDEARQPAGAGSSATAETARVDRAAFTDQVLRESVVRLGSLAFGVRRALAPATRNRIRFEMKREVKRARKQRQADMRAAHRDWRDRRRAGVDDDLRDTA